MQLTLKNVRQWARDNQIRMIDYCGAHVLRGAIGDYCSRCDDCGEVFTSRADLDEDWFCEDCDVARHNNDYGIGRRPFNARREWGTY